MFFFNLTITTRGDLFFGMRAKFDISLKKKQTDRHTHAAQTRRPRQEMALAIKNEFPK